MCSIEIVKPTVNYCMKYSDRDIESKMRLNRKI